MFVYRVMLQIELTKTMEAKFVDLRFNPHNDRLRDTVQFIPVKNVEDELLATEISEDRLLVIDQDEEEAERRPEDIEIAFQVTPTALRIVGISLNIANCPKCEIYSDECYLSVECGEKQEDMPELDVYKYEISFSKRPSANISLKFKSTGSEVLIFGIDAFVCPVSRPSPAGIDLQHVEDMLAQSNLGISKAAERCKDFLKTSLNRPTTTTTAIPRPPSDSNIQGVLHILDHKMIQMEARLKEHIDDKFQALEASQEKHFREIMQRMESSSSSSSSK